MSNIKIGTVLLAKSWHSERERGGNDVAIVLREPSASFVSI